MITQDDIIQALDNLKTRKRDYLKPKDYKDFLPVKLPKRGLPVDRSVYEANQQSILDKADSRYSIQATKAKNQRDFEKMLAAQRTLERAQKAMKAANRMQPPIVNGKPGRIQFSNEVVGPGMQAGLPTNAKVGVGQNLGRYNWNGYGLTLNKGVSDRFIGFLNALRGTGYKINSIGTFANRNIAGTSTKSLHSYGLAMDVNPSQNPVAYGRVITDLPKGIGRLAAKYGLAWGGAWNGPKYDPMHFSVPYGGRK